MARSSASHGERLEQLLLALEGIAATTEGSGALARQTAAAGIALREQSASLGRLFAAFVLGREHARGPVRITLVASNPGQPARARSPGRPRSHIAPVPAPGRGAPATAGGGEWDPL